jgi:ADP-ribose pyrophosphatase YjhB (NUDIX family)
VGGGATSDDTDSWADLARRLQAIAQNGLAFAANEYEVKRYEAVREVAAEIMSRRAGVPRRRIAAMFELQTGEATPKVDVRAVVPSAGRLLFVRQRSDGLWSLPGGWADPGESPREAAEREVREETGIETSATRLIGVYDRARRGGVPSFPFHVYKLFIVCEPKAPLSAAPRVSESHEVTATGLFGRDELPTLSLSRVLPSEIDDVFMHLADPTRPATFD